MEIISGIIGFAYSNFDDGQQKTFFYESISFDRFVIARANYEQLCSQTVVKVARSRYYFSR